MARFTFFVGKGGVGKTTVSSAYALHRAAAETRRRFLLLSTDPAHSLADVLQVKVGDRPIRLRAAGQLWARQLDAGRQIAKFLAGERADLLALLGKGSLFTAQELEPLLDTSLPGMAEVAALLAVDELLASRYDGVLVDTAPMGHAIRLFQMPEHFAQFLDVLELAASRDAALAEQFGGRVRREPALQRWSRMVARIESALAREGSRLVMVTTPEGFSLNQAVRAAANFANSSARQPIDEIVLNRAVVAAKHCVTCGVRAAQARDARKFLRRHFPAAKVFLGEDPGCPILGTAALRAFGAHIFQARALPSAVRKRPPKSTPVDLQRAEWPPLATPLTLTLGKGGVGKTTISAALAFHQRQTAKREMVAICSIDPAPSLDDVFLSEVCGEPQPVLGDDKLRAAEFDALSQFARWRDGLRARLTEAMTAEDRGVHIDLSLDRKFLLALLDVVPPGVDEIFAVFRILELLESDGRVVIDMAPTGHAIEVLQTPARLLTWTRLLLKTLAAHRALPMARNAAVEVATLAQKVREIAEVFCDPRRTAMMIVTLPEPLPNYETRRLLDALKELRAPVRALIVNRVLMARNNECARCKLAAEWQAFSLAQLRQQSGGGAVFIARQFDGPIAGAPALRRFTRELWRMQRS